MRVHRLIDHDTRHGSDRPARRDRRRPVDHLVLFPTVVAAAWALLVAVFASVGRMFGPEDERGTWGDVAGAVFGNFAVVFVGVLAVSVVIRVSRHRAARNAVTCAGESRRVALAAALGALPGVLIAVVPVLLHELDLISSDQSQIGFAGLPIMVVGAVVGSGVAGSHSGMGMTAVFGCVAGFAVGLAAGVVIGAAYTGLAGAWLLLAPLGMVIGAALATCVGRRHPGRQAHD